MEPLSSSESSGVLVDQTQSVQYHSRSGASRSKTNSPAPFATSLDQVTTRTSTSRNPHRRPWVTALGRTFRRRIPQRKGSVLVFLLNVIESFAFYGAINSILRILFMDSSLNETALILLVQFTAGRLMYPIAGFLGDVFFGRFRMMQIGIGLFWLAFALLSLFLSLGAGEVGDKKTNTFILPIITFVLICAGSGAIEVTIIPFGVDQLSQGASSHEQSSYFYWFYFGRQLGNLAGVLSFHGLSLLKIEQNSDHNKYGIASIQSIVALTGMTFALILIWWFKNVLFKDRQRENPLRDVVNVVCYAATVKDTPPINRRAFCYGERKKPRIERAKFRYDGLYTSEEVEDVKTFCKILLVLFSLGLCFMTYTGVSPVPSLP